MGVKRKDLDFGKEGSDETASEVLLPGAPSDSGQLSIQPDRAEFVKELFGLSAGGGTLIVGDGNLSFASSMACLAADATIVATTFESVENFQTNFASSSKRVQALREKGVRVFHGVDATNLAGTLLAPDAADFSTIIFQFPQHPDRRKINKHRELLRGFFASACAKLSANGKVVVSLCKGQGGTAAETVQKPAGDTWQVQDLAAESGMILVRAEPCPVDELTKLGYTCTGFRATGTVHQEREFNLEGALTHVFCRDTLGLTAVHPIIQRHDISFWVLPSFQESVFKELVEEVCGPRISTSLTLLDEYVSPEDGRQARTYRIHMDTSQQALSARCAKEFGQTIRAQAASTGAEQRRRAQG
mmetsp:Transcript_2873/g.7259  ORF Transcript_2873/g.7259 Transcript_2873/m.7259 type:complete len:359 (+) Transcript_2873:60-1136(+)